MDDTLSSILTQHHHYIVSQTNCMLTFVIIVCGGNMYVITTTCSKLTWLEEWVLYLEYVLGHSISRGSDYEKEYDLHQNSCRRVLWSKLTKLL